MQAVQHWPWNWPIPGRQGCITVSYTHLAEPTEKEKKTVQGGSSLEDLAALLGMQDSETESLLGGGEENWTEDHSFYIGRIYQAEMYGETYPVYTTCSSQGIVDSVSLRIVSGERQVTSEEVQELSLIHISQICRLRSWTFMPGSLRASCFTITNRIRAFLLLKAPRSSAGPWMPDMSRCPF